jgi:hypothetical protein
LAVKRMALALILLLLRHGEKGLRIPTPRLGQPPEQQLR